MSQPPNILVIIADQLAWRALPAYGDTYAQSPNINRIAARGVRFSQAYTPCPLCQPARAALWTGRFPHETGVLSNGRRHPVPPVPEEMPTVGELLSAAGYRAVHVGKTHDAGSLRGFHVEPPGELPVEGSAAWPVGADTRRDRHTTERAVDYLREGLRDGPYLLVVDLNNPHDICSWVGHNQGQAVRHDLPVPLPPLPPNHEDRDLTRRPLPVQYICCSHNRLSQAASWDAESYGYYLAAYYHYIARVDAEIGRVLDALEARPDVGDTMVLFFADHGDGMAAHRMVTKQVSFYDETTRVPLMVAGPGVAGEGRQVEGALVSLLDLLPTLCDAAGIAAPEGLWGRSLLPWLREARDDSPHAYIASEWHTEWGYTIEPGRMVRTAGHMYARYLEGDGEELYDLTADPGQTRTLAGEADHAEVLAAHRELLQRHVAETSDPFFGLSYEVDPRWRAHAPGYANHVGPAAPMLDA